MAAKLPVDLTKPYKKLLYAMKMAEKCTSKIQNIFYDKFHVNYHA